ncbi:MAG: hypothetical protein CMJ62_06240 [Planctomycetaceae bacterium]|nr:hypothetical protein [Planctomycetaceae bacterium]
MEPARWAPRGRPPCDHKYKDGAWVHIVTGQPFDPIAHAHAGRMKKRTCMRKHYWDRGGRERRLTRYVRKSQRNQPPQLTIDAFTAMDDMKLYLPKQRA